MQLKLSFAASSAVCAIAAAMVATSASAQDRPDAAAKVNATAPAEDAQDRASQDIIVTAQRRSERLQDVPISITALSASQLSATGVTSTHDLAQAVTGLTVTESGGYVQPFIRGVGSTVTNLGEQGSAATYIDGVYMPVVVGQLYQLANIESIQVLKGPQGTLFGRNANTGAIIITTRQPQFTPSGTINVGYGNYNAFTASGFVTGPIVDGVAASLAGNYDSHDGWFTNLNQAANGGPRRLGDAKRYAVRGTILIEPTSKLKITLTADGMNSNDASPLIIQPASGGYQGYVPGALLPKSPYDYIGNVNTGYINGQWGVSGRINWDLGPVSLVSTTAYRSYASDSSGYDSDTTPIAYVAISQRDVGSDFTQEVQLNSGNKGNFKWVVGGFYMRQQANYAPLQVVGGPVLTTITAQQVTEAYAGFADATYKLGAFDLTGGIRYNSETKRYNGQRNGVQLLTNANKTWNSVTPRVVLAFHPSRDIMLYGSFSQGFKSGTFNANSLSAIPVNPETVDAYEAGFKLSPVRGVTVNGAVFHYLTNDLQVQALDPATNLINIINAAKVRSNGADLDVTWAPIRDLSLKLGVSYLNAKFTSFPNAQVYVPVVGGDGRNMSVITDVTGKRNVRSPDWTFNLSADYKFELGNGSSIVPSFNVYHSSKFFWTVDNRLAEPEHTILNASLTYNLPGDHFSASIWGRNITDELRFRVTTVVAQADRRTPDDPATYGFRLGYKF